ncbi:hypothetical protein KSS87_015416 [Heliosperma pusillum]|nr:hypothetical protein KSS87_015416 [Heliosperma pusillum]
MGCFTTCFSNCKPSRRRRRRRSPNSFQHPSLLHHLQNYQSVDDFRVPQLIQQEEEADAKDEEQEQEQEQEGEENERNNIDILHDSM